MSQPFTRHIVLRNIFLALFVVSTLVLVVLMITGPLVGNVFSQINSSLEWPPSPQTPSNTSEGIGFTMVIGSVITSITSLAGFIVTAVITWRKEKREASLADVQRKKLETELEKSKFELEELKKSAGKKKVRSKK
jgi:hypothetical protein